MKMRNSTLYSTFVNITGEDNVLVDEPMSLHTTFRVGGPADFFLMPKSAEEAVLLIEVCRDSGCGNGSNLLVSDKGIRGAVIRIGKQMGRIETEDNEITAEAGASLAAIAQAALAAGLAGFEFAAGIPGTLGGACVMNAGAYGGEMKQVLTSVRAISLTGSAESAAEAIVEIPAGELGLGYRTSCLQKNGMIVVSARMRLREGDPEEITALMDDLRARRLDKQPLDLPSAGSTFKRPEGHFAGKLIMDAGLRGYRVGGASVSEKHCGFVVNDGGATAEDILTLIDEVRERVFREFGVTLEPEVKFVGER